MGLLTVLRRSIVQNTLALTAVQFAGYILPLVTLPYLARVLEKEQFGLLLAAQSLAMVLALIIEYGFHLSGTREVARVHNNLSQLSLLVNGIQSAKIALLMGVVALGLLFGQFNTLFKEHPQYLILALLLAGLQGLNPLWYFQGKEQMKMPAALDVAGKAVATVGIFLVVQDPIDAWKVLAMQSIGVGLSLLITLSWMYKEVPPRIVPLKDVWNSLQMGFSMFFFRAAVSLYTSANILILGLLVSPTAAAYFGGAERLVKGVVGILYPVSQAVFPRMNSLLYDDPTKAKRLAQISLYILLFGSTGLALLVFFLAPDIVLLILGPGYEAAIPLMQVLSLLIPLIAVSNVLGIQWMLPLRLDRAFNTIVVAAGLINLGLILFLVPRYGTTGMAWSVVISETFVTLGMYIALRLRGLDLVGASPLLEKWLLERKHEV